MRAFAGTVEGVITLEPEGLPLSQVKVWACDRSAQVSKDGTFVIPEVKQGACDIFAEWPEMGSQTKPGVKIDPDKPTFVEFAFMQPRPYLETIVPSAIEIPKEMMIRGDFFFHQANAPFEVFWGDKPLKAIRVSNKEIRIPEAEIADYLQKNPLKKAVVEMTVTVKVLNRQSQEARIALLSLKRATIKGKVVQKGLNLPYANAKVFVEGDNAVITPDDKGAYEIPNVIPGDRTVVVSWPDQSIRNPKTLYIPPGDTVELGFNIEAQEPKIISAEPKQLNYESPITIRGDNFISDKNNQVTVRIGTVSLDAKRISGKLLYIPKKTLQAAWKGLASQKSFDLMVLIGDKKSNSFPLELPAAADRSIASKK